MSDFPDWMLHFAHLETAKRKAREAVTDHYRASLRDEPTEHDTGFSAGKVAAVQYLAGESDE